MIGAPMLEEIVLEQVKQRFSGESMREHVRSIEEQIRADIAAKEHAVKASDEEAAGLEKRLAKLEDDYFKGDLDGKTYGRLLERVEAEKERIREQGEGARRALADAKAATVDVGHLQALAERLDVWDSLSPESLKQLLRDVVDRVLIYQQKSQAPKGMKNPNELEVKIAFRTDVLVTNAGTIAS
jgi:septal ring factor EnvC (AmiA/AmiB activator)